MTTRKKKKKAAKAKAPDSPVETPAEAPPAAAAEREPETLRAERDDLLARLQRVSADYLNYQKRVQRDIAETREFANAELVKSLLPVLDDMERALATARDNHGEDDALFGGLKLVHEKALEILGKFGVRVIEAEGQAFDPERHLALMQQPSGEHPPQTVLGVIEKGYELKGRPIRPARVVISTAAEPPTEPDNDQAEQE